MEKPMNPESKGYDNLGWESPKDLAKTHENEELEWFKDAQGDETGWECSKEWNGPKKHKIAWLLALR